MSKSVSIIIVTYNGMKWIEKCLNSIPENYDVIIIDNNSTDNTVAFIEENYTDLYLIKESKNLGFGSANNIGMSYALNKGADYVFLLNQDAYLIDTVIDDLILVHQNNKDYGILSPIHLNGGKTKMDKNFHNYILENKDFVNDLILKNTFKSVYDISFVNAAAWLIPKETILKIGGFDPLFYHYAEDNNYCNRLVYHNLKVGFVANTFIIHDREFREKKGEISAKDRLKLKERFYKSNLANINVDFDYLFAKYSKINRKGMINSVLQLKSSVFKRFYLENKLLYSLKSEIKRSRKINVNLKTNYLDYEN